MPIYSCIQTHCIYTLHDSILYCSLVQIPENTILIQTCIKRLTGKNGKQSYVCLQSHVVLCQVEWVRSGTWCPSVGLLICRADSGWTWVGGVKGVKTRVKCVWDVRGWVELGGDHWKVVIPFHTQQHAQYMQSANATPTHTQTHTHTHVHTHTHTHTHTRTHTHTHTNTQHTHTNTHTCSTHTGEQTTPTNLLVPAPPSSSSQVTASLGSPLQQ